MQKIRVMSGNTLKLLACAFMLIDHIGMIFFPWVSIYRIIGRLAFPIFAFMISEGARYTKNKLRYFLTLLVLAAIIEAVYYALFRELVLSIFVTFSCSIPIIYALALFKRELIRREHTLPRVIGFGLLLLALIAAVYLLSREFYFDYGFKGAMVPVAASLFTMPKDAPERLRRLDCIPLRVLCCGVMLLALAVTSARIQYFSLLALIPLLLYSGKRGGLRIKYFFYLFYPLHIAVLQALYWIINA